MNDDARRRRDDEEREWTEAFRRVGDQPVECPAPELIQAARSDVLSPVLSQAISAHVAGCLTCRVLAESLDTIADDGPTAEESERILQRVREAARSDTARRSVRMRRWVWLGATAAAALVFATWWLVRSAIHRPTLFEVQAVVLAPESAVDAAETDDLQIALVPYRAGRFGEAIHSLSAFTVRHPRNAYGHFYLGVAHLRQSSEREALGALESAERLARQGSVVAEEAGWHLALAYHRLGEDDKAWTRFMTLCAARPGFSKACGALRELAPTMDLQGTVTDVDGRPMEGARITEHLIRFAPAFVMSEPAPFLTVSGGAGRYRVIGEPSSSSNSVLMRASRPGYFTSNARVDYARAAIADFVLHPLRFVGIGESIRSTTARDAWCDPDELCQRYALAIRRTGTLAVELLTSDRSAMDVYVEMPDGRIFGPRPRAPMRLDLPVDTGATVQIRVLSFKGPASFELRTELR